jgi:hypothetical protein
LVVVMAVAAAPARAAVVINELLADPSASAGDANGDGVINTSDDEFVELVNTGAGSVALTGWKLSDAVRVRHVFGEADVIPGGGFFVVFGGGSPGGFSQASVASSGLLGLNNGGDTISLLGPDDAVLDMLTYGAEGGGDASLSRSPDGIGPLALHTSVSSAFFSPGTTLAGASQLPGSAPPPVDPPPTEPPPADPPPVEPPPAEPPIDLPPIELPGSSGGLPVVPEPASIALFLPGLLAVMARRRGK